MRRIVAYLTALAFLLAPTLVWADPVEVELHYIPIGQRLICNGEEFQCYTFDEWKQLIEVDAQLHFTEQQLTSVKLQLDLANQHLDIADKINLNLYKTIDTLTLEVERVREENDRLMKENARLSMPKLGPWIVFIAGLVFCGVGVGLVVGSQK